jgi:hypothetical protein
MVCYGLQGGICGGVGCVELIDACINTKALERATGMSQNTTTNPIEKVKKMWVLRVRQISAGEKKPSNTAIYNCQEPLQITHAMRWAKMHLIHSTIKLYLIDELMMQDVVAVEEWVLMRSTSTDADHIGAGTKRNYDETTQPSTPSVKTPTNTSTQKMPTSIMLNVVSTDTNNHKCHTLHQVFPVISSFNPGMLQRRRRVVNGVDLVCQLFQGMIDESVKLCTKLNEPLQFQYQNGEHDIWLIKLPMSKSNSGIVTPNIKKCIDEMLLVFNDNDKDGAHDVVLYVLLCYLVKSNRTGLMEKLCEKMMVPTVMDKYDCAALLDESGIKIWQWRKIQQCLKVFMDIKQVGMTENCLRALGVDHGEIKHRTYYYSDPTNPSKVKEEVRYWTKNPVYEFVQMLQDTINGYNLNPLDIYYIHIFHGRDHGKNKICFASKLILSMEDGKLYSQVLGLADVACRKDHTFILDSTCMPLIMKGINTIEEINIVFHMHWKPLMESSLLMWLHQTGMPAAFP